MIECDAITRKWGNSLGMILPRNIVEEEKIVENEKIKILILKQDNILTKTFGALKGKLKNDSQQLKNEARKELYHA